ncbi:MAG: hypothetical protein AAGE52_18315 [Myxococcota bacterium]
MTFLRVLLLLALTACGSRSPLKVGPPRDAGPDAPPTDPLEVDCGRSIQFTTPGRPLVLTATTTSEVGIVRSGWTLEDGPPMSVASVAPPTGPTTTLQQDTLGLYILRFTAEDAEGRVERCDVQVESIVGPPRALCPEEEIRTPSGVPVRVVGDGFDDVAVIDFRWEVVRGPGPAMLTTPESPVTDFIATLTGPYVLQLTVTDGDGATNSCQITVVVVGPPMLMCPDVVEAPTRQPTVLEVIATDDTEVSRVDWEIVAAPRGSSATLVDGPRDGNRWTATFTPDLRGEYFIRATATDEDGLTATCEFVVIGLPTPPDAVCPETVETTPLEEIRIEGDAVDDGEIVSWRWSLVERAPGSSAADPSPRGERITTFLPDLAGEYRVQLTVTDDDGNMASCTTLVRAIATEGLRVEMFWDTDGTDMDLHLLNEGGRRWRTEDDCYFRNCIPTGPDWGGGGSDDDPSLDIDDTDGMGPENINVDDPQPGIYRVGAYAYGGTGNVTVRVYCGGSTTEPRATFGPTRIVGTGARHDFWRVADVEISGGGCRITELDDIERVEHDSSASFPR